MHENLHLEGWDSGGACPNAMGPNRLRDPELEVLFEAASVD